MKMICIFEDGGYADLLPLVYMRPVYELRCGIDLLRDKIIRKYPASKVNLFCRDYLSATLKERTTDAINEIVNGNKGTIFINGRILLNRQIPVEGKEEVGIKGKTLVYARLNKDHSKLMTPEMFLEGKALAKLKGKVPFVKVEDITVFKYSWEIIHENGKQICKDFDDLAEGGKIKGKLYDGVHILDKKNLFIDEDSIVKPGVVLDASEGSIYIGKGVKVFPNAVIEGPAYIGDNSTVKIGAKIYRGTSVGEGCKVGGEVEESIFHSYSNKQHEGFLGHAYIGQWCNIAADTNDSDLKNNYSTVRVYVNGKYVDTGEVFVGLTMGDHSKTGINSMFNTGTVIGLNVNIFGAQLPPKFVPSFCWGASGVFVVYQPDKAIKVAERVMARRKIKLTKAQKDLFMFLYKMTESERDLNRIIQL